ncbi:D-amino-acid dehydrogenase [Gemmobacter megaterium]|uniref:D-amino-acid dehydrogenase n=1 Tax=Gemmobacter megaterium TaxID=1086013 RepID=A0A1N7PPN7_9RHOB|nr:FAD-dependent oxidoreductase [Gemmobacter megaterium]GGE20272.1 D-amino-acid dehydrogenase [Gemmobacter megaterium]SIT12379.1 D-amino-acid dehydrogenase [Gemmobacter megaterium]
MSEVMVLGAGMVGVSTALALQAAGRAVVLVDRQDPGRETSYGNAGIIQGEAVEPYGLPRDLVSLWRIVLGQDNAVSYHLNALPSHLEVLWRYFRASAPARHRHASQTYAGLIQRATNDHAPLIAAAGADKLIRRDGFRTAARSERPFAAQVAEAERLERSYGVRISVMDGDALAAAEPALKLRFAGAIHWHDGWTCSDPGALVAAYADLFRARGGKIASADAMLLQQDGAGWKLGPHQAADVVVALGPWSPMLLARFGYRIPLLRKRGYHRHFRGGATLDLPMMDTSIATVLAPMATGLRVLTGAELARPGAPPTPRQLARAETAAREILDLGDQVELQPWMGNRPCMPDMIPLVGQAPRHRGLWFHFGHGHQGFTLGPTTAALLAEHMSSGRAPIPALDPARRTG